MPYKKIPVNNLITFSADEKLLKIPYINKLFIKIFYRSLMYRKAMDVVDYKILGHKYLFPVCPGCNCTMDREYQSYCDRCGQKLKWKKFNYNK